MRKGKGIPLHLHSGETRMETSIKRCYIRASRSRMMRTTLSLDDELVAEATSYTGLTEKAALVREALKALIERESAGRLARLGGSDPDAEAPPRRRARA